MQYFRVFIKMPLDLDAWESKKANGPQQIVTPHPNGGPVHLCAHHPRVHKCDVLMSAMISHEIAIRKCTNSNKRTQNHTEFISYENI